VGVWYHVLELAPGVLTPGVYDMRPHVGRFGLPARLDGLRVLDVGAGNGFFSFHFERLGAARVVAVDLPRITDHDAPAWYLERRRRELGAAKLADLEHHELHGGFEVAHRALGSRVERVLCRAVELPGHLDERFDLIFCCNVLIHHRDPVALAEAWRSCSRPVDCSCSPRPSTRAPTRPTRCCSATWRAPPGGCRARARWPTSAGWAASPKSSGSAPSPCRPRPEPDRAGIMGVLHARQPTVAGG
jgi:SAM-dependent methyltransferase